MTIALRTRRELYRASPSGKKGEGGPATSDYPNDDTIRKDFLNPPGPYVFWSNDSTRVVAYNFANSIDGVIVDHGGFPKYYTDQNKRSDEWYQDFADRFSAIFAEKASGDVYLVAAFSRKIAACRVWSRMEFPTLMDNANVERIIQVNPSDFADQNIIWTPQLPVSS